jgi:uncharacterized protein (DUF488 family)
METDSIGLIEMIHTIGHSTREWPEFLDLLKGFGVQTLADIRTVPRSRRHPHFSIDRLPAALGQEGIGYVHLAALGGLRKPRPDSIHTGLRVEGFRGYADHMETETFRNRIEELIGKSAQRRICVMCAEAVPWKCHRLLLSDALTVRGVRVEHILAADRAELHRVTPWASVDGTRLLYIK